MKIYLENIKIYAYHGVLPEERMIGTYYWVNVELHSELSKALETDDLNDTTDYAKINEIVHQEMKISSQLMEHVVGRIFKSVEAKFPKISYMKIRITKTAPPMQGECDGASVEFEKTF